MDIEAAAAALKQGGFINYYGLQRFGSGSVPTHRWVTQDWGWGRVWGGEGASRAQLKQGGFISHYGLQQFGSGFVPTHWYVTHWG